MCFGLGNLIVLRPQNITDLLHCIPSKKLLCTRSVVCTTTLRFVRLLSVVAAEDN